MKTCLFRVHCDPFFSPPKTFMYVTLVYDIIIPKELPLIISGKQNFPKEISLLPK